MPQAAGRGSPVGQVQVSGSMSAEMRLQEVAWRTGFSRQLDALAAAGGEAFIAPGGERMHSPLGARRPLFPSGRTSPGGGAHCGSGPSPPPPCSPTPRPARSRPVRRGGLCPRPAPCAQLKTALRLRLQSWKSNLPPCPPWRALLCVNSSGLRDARTAGET